MNKGNSPYRDFLANGLPGMEASYPDYRIRDGANIPRREDSPVIGSVIKAQNDMVVVFDIDGEQIPGCQGWYEQVRSYILENAPPTAVFSWALNGETRLKIVPREEW